MDALYIRLNNYLSFKKEYKKLDKNGIILVIGKNDENADESDGNGSGKTGFISSIPFAYFNRPRGILGKELLNEDVIYIDENGNRAKKAEVEIGFEHSGMFYKVYRSVTDKGSQTLAFHSSTEFDYEKTEWTDLTLKAGTNKRTEKKESGIVRTEQRITDIIGCDVDLFINSVFFEQSNIDTFARGSLSEKDQIFKNAIGLGRWEDYGKAISDDNRKVEKEISKVQTLIEDAGEVSDIEDTIKCSEKIIVNEKDKIDETKKWILSEDKRKETIVKEILKIQSKIVNVDDLIKEKNEATENAQTFKAEVDKKEKAVESNNDDILECDEGMKVAIKDADEHVEKLEILKKELKNYTQTDKEETEKKRSESLKKVSEFETLISINIEKGKAIPNMKCEFGFECDKLTPKAKDTRREELLKEYNGLKSKFDIHEKEFQTIEEKTIDIENDLINFRTIEKLETAVDACKKDYESCESSITLLEKVIKEDKEAIIFSKSEHDKLCEKMQEINVKINKASKEPDNLKGLINDKDVIIEGIDEKEEQLNEFKKKVTQSEERIKDCKEKIKKAKELDKQLKILQEKRVAIAYSLYMVRKKIPHLLISNAIPELRTYAKEFIYKLSDGRLDLDIRMDKDLKSKTDGKANKAQAFDIWVNVDGKWLKYAQTSGGERARADVAIHLSYVCIMSNRAGGKLENIFLDEVGAALDKRGVDNFVDILHHLVDVYKFKKLFVVTQNIEMKRKIDNRILVTKTREGSKISE